jgi:hypothetical protein
MERVGFKEAEPAYWQLTARLILGQLQRESLEGDPYLEAQSSVGDTVRWQYPGKFGPRAAPKLPVDPCQMRLNRFTGHK